MPDPTTLSEKNRAKLDGIVQQMISNGESDDNIKFVVDDFKSKYAEKKNPVGSSPSTTPKENTDLAPKTGSSVSKSTQGFPEIDTNSILPDFDKMKSVNTQKPSIPKGSKYRLTNDDDFKEMQSRGEAPPNSELKLDKTPTNKNLYTLNPDGTPVKEKEVVMDQSSLLDFNKKQTISSIEQNNKNAQSIPKGAKLKLFGEKEKPVSDDPKLTEELYNFTENDKKEIRKEIDSKIEDNDLDLEHPFLYYSTFNKQDKPKDNFVDRVFGEEKLTKLNINVADFDGFLNKKGYKNEYLNKEENGLFDGNGRDISGGYDIKLAEEIQKRRLLSLYMGEIDGRDKAKRKLENKKSNLDKASKDQVEDENLGDYTKFDSQSVNEFIDSEMPNLSKKIKEIDSENKELYANHKARKGNSVLDWVKGFGYGGKETFNNVGYGFIDKVNQIGTTVLDKIGANDKANELRFLNEERALSRPNTREVGYASGLTATKDGTNYLFTEDGRIIDRDLKIDVTDLLQKPEYDSIKNSAKQEKKSDYTFSPQGSFIQFGKVAGDMIVQLALQRSLGNIAPSLSKIPLSKSMSSSIVTQSALGYVQGMSETYKQAIDAGISEKEAKLLANEAGINTGILYAVTSPMSPNTKATQALFGAEGKELIKKSIQAYSETGKKGFLETLKSGMKTIPRHAVNWVEEGLVKEGSQELVQQVGETYGVNAETNRKAGQELAKDTMSGTDVVNTLIQTTLSGGLAVVPNMFSKTDKLKSYATLSKDPNFERDINELVANQVVTPEQANVLKKDVKIFKNNINKIPDGLNKDIAMDVMSELETISELETKKKNLDPSFHEPINAEIEQSREKIKSMVGLSTDKAKTEPKTASTEPTSVLSEESNKTQTSQPSSSEEATPSVTAKIEGNSPLLPSETKENGSKVEGNLPLKENQEISPVEDVVAPSVEKPKLSKKEKSQVQEKVVSEPRVLLRSGKIGTDAFFALPNEGVFGEVVDKVGSDEKVSAYQYPEDFKIKDLSKEAVFDDYMSNKMFEGLKEEGYDAAYVMEIDGSKVLHVINPEKLTLLDEKLPELRNNETTPPTNTPTDGNVSVGDQPNDAQGKNNELQPAVDARNGEEKTGLVLFHGSPHAFENFDITKLGSGEGAQAFGHGLYFTNEVDIANGYANKLSSKKNFWEALRDGNEISLSKEDFEFLRNEMDALGYDGQRAENSDIGNVKVDGKDVYSPETLEALAVAFGKDAKNYLKDYDLTEEQITRFLEIKKKISNPQLYKVAIHEGKTPSEYDYIDWREPLSKKQIDKIGLELPENTIGKDAYEALSKKLGSDKKASEFLLSKGIDGISYKSNKGTGGKDGKGRNYVIFDSNSIRVDEINNEKQVVPINAKPSKGEVKVTTKKVKSVKDGEFDVDFNENGIVTAIRSSKDGRVIPKFVERQIKKPTKKYPNGRKILSKNANYAKIEADAYGELTNNQQNAVEKQEQKVVDEKIRAFEPNDEYEIALKYVAEGGKVKLSSARKETGEKNSKAMKWAAGFNKESDLPSIENVAEKLMPTDSSLDESLIREHLIDIFSNFENQDAVKKHLLEVYEENNVKKQDQERHAFLGSLSEKDFSMYQAIQAEDNYLAELSDTEVKEYYNQILDENEQGQQEYAKGETANQRPEVITGRDEGEAGNEGIQERQKAGGIDLKSTPDQILEWLDQQEKNLDNFGKENLSVGIPIILAKGAIQAMRVAVKAGKLAAEVIQAGLDHVKQSDWYKNLTQNEKDEIDNDFQGNFLNKINAIDPSNEKQAENLLNRAVSSTISEDDAYDEVKTTFEKARTELANKKLPAEYVRDAYRNFVKRFSDRQYLAKTLLNKSGMKAVQNLIINSHGTSGKARIQFQEAYDKIYKKLTTEERKTLDEVIQAKRFIAIDTNREARGLEPVSHPNFIDKNKSEKFLSKLEKEIGTEKYNDLVQRANAYFDTYKGLLKDMLDNGLISKESFDSMSDVDYQPRVFLQYITDFNGDMETNKRTNNLDTGGLSSDQIKAMSEGDANSLVLNSEWLLANSLLARSKAMAMNNINKRFMTDEYQKAKARFDALDSKNLKGDDARFYKYFKELSSKVIDNPIIGQTESGNNKYKYDKTPLNYAKMYYYIDGQQHQFFLEKDLHESWNDNIGGFLSSDAKEFLSYASGSALVKAIATGNNPAFPIVNTPRDFMFNIAFSDQYSKLVPKAMFQVAKDVASSVKEIAKKDSEVLKKYIEYGGAMDFLSSQGRLKKESVIGKIMEKNISANTRDTSKKIFDAVTLHKISAYSEMMFRLGVFQRTIKNQVKELGLQDISEVTDKQQRDDIYNQAVANARSMMDFNQGGSITKDLESVIPYINAATQGGRVAISSFEKDPVGTTARLLQIATIASTVPIGISLALISAMKSDDDEDKTASEIYLHAMSGISKYQKSKYMNIVTGVKDDEGEYQVLKIAKSQELSPVISITDDIYANLLRKIAGKEKKSAGSITQDALFTLNSNVMPIDVTSPAGLITRTPMVKAVLTYQTGYDFFRDEPLSMDIGKVPLAVEGINQSSTEDFYKKLGPNFGLSPIRSKAFVESLITGPSTNPFVGMLYGGADAATSDKDMKKIGAELFNTIYKSTGKRVVSYSTDFNRKLSGQQELQKEIDAINIEKYLNKAKFKELGNQFLNKEITPKELNTELEKLDPYERQMALGRIKDLRQLKGVSGTVLDIKYEREAKAKALMIMHYYGDIFDGRKENDEVKKEMMRAKGIITPKVMFEYNKLKEELNKKTPN